MQREAPRMAVGRSRTTLSALLVVAASTASAEPAAEAECAALGFAPSLLCSACDKLSDAVGADDALITECRGCCTEEVNGTGGTYAKATLDICR